MSSIRRIVLGAFAAVVGLGFIAGSTASAAPVLGAKVIVAADGDVVATFLGQTAGYDNELYLDSPANGLGRIFHNHLNSPGDTFDMGFFTAGTELIFKIYVVPTGDTFYTGPAIRNPDGIEHATVDNAGGVTTVGFEDLFGGGDRDFDDTVFQFSNSESSVPVPASAISGFVLLGGLGLVLRPQTPLNSQIRSGDDALMMWLGGLAEV